MTSPPEMKWGACRAVGETAGDYQTGDRFELLKVVLE
jgi:hypothetical protein